MYLCKLIYNYLRFMGNNRFNLLYALTQELEDMMFEYKAVKKENERLKNEVQNYKDFVDKMNEYSGKLSADLVKSIIDGQIKLNN